MALITYVHIPGLLPLLQFVGKGEDLGTRLL